MRVDGATVAALTATASMYADGRGSEIPVWQMATAHAAELESRAEQVVARVGAENPSPSRPAPPCSGAGSVPGASVPSPVIIVAGKADQIFSALLAGEPPVLARREAGRVIVDLRAFRRPMTIAWLEALSVACRS